MATEFPISDVITVNITRETLFPSRAGFGTINLVGTSSVIDHGERIRYYTSIAGVAADFLTTDEEYIGASAGFSQSPKPTRIGISSVLTADAAGFIKGGAAGTTAAFIAVSDGTFTVSIDGSPEDITAMNFTGDVTLDDIAATIQTALRVPATGGFTSALCVNENGRLKITSGTTGAASTVSPLTVQGTGTDISGDGFINALIAVATVVDGVTYVDLATELTSIETANDDWYGLALTRDLNTTANYLAAAGWAETRKHILGAFDDSLIALDPANSNDLASQLKTLAYARTFTHWNHDAATYPEVSMLARLATVDYLIPNAAITLKFKTLPGIAPVSISSTQRTALIAKRANVYVTRGGVNMLEEGNMASGEFIDVIHSVDWMEDAIAVDVFGTLTSSSTKVPMSDTGGAQLQAVVKDVLDEAVTAGILAKDFDDNDELQPAYTISTVRVLTLPESQRANRIGPPITFTGRLGGAIHAATISGVVTV